VGKTLAEKILSEHALPVERRGGKGVSAGEVVIVRVDVAYVQDGTGPLAVRQMQNMGLERAFDPQRVIFFLDHASPSPRLELSNDHKLLREFAAKTGIRLSEVGGGISHQVVNEEYAAPGMVIVGADSHTCSNGSMGAFATGMGSSDVAVAIALGKTWMRVPETIKIVVHGQPPKGVYAMDIILHIIGTLGSSGATYKALEYAGEAMERLPMHGRLTMANLAVEAGAKVGLFPSDAITKAHLERLGRGRQFREMAADPDAVYERVVEFDAASLQPTVACPHLVDNTKTVEELGKVRVDEVFMGTSANGRLEDFQVAARILKGRRVQAGTRLIVTPASRRIWLEGMRDGTFQTLVEAGAVVTGPGCGACVGVHEGVLADGEVCLATQPRNFKGRMGNPKAFIYLGSPATAAASAITGHITDPREFL
jgi:3-isopropylmalate/(R)-2-methylmalate dehydratase large subunit